MTESKKNNNQFIKKLLKRFLGLWIFFLLFLGINNEINAQSYMDPNFVWPRTVEEQQAYGAQNTLDKTLQETKALLDITLRIIYIISRPLLIIAWNAMDNSLVYWSVFHLDAPLRKFWNIMKNFANYALWFVLLYNILKSLFGRKWIGSFKDGKSPLWIVKNILIAGILIQASRFLLSAIIDISTIATYAIWWMPLTILKNSDAWDKKILWVNSTMNLSDATNSSQNILEDTIIYRTYWNNPEYKISNCKIWSGTNSRFIIWKEINFIAQTWWNNTWWISLETWICILWWMPYKFNEFPELNTATDNYTYKSKIEDIISNNITLSWYEECGFVIPIFAQLKYNPKNCFYSWQQINENELLWTWNFWYLWWSWRLNNITWWTTLSTLIDKSKWFVWPLITIYSSTLNLGQMISNDWWWDSLSFGIILKFAIKAFMWIMLILPILALAIIMLARIGVLRITIAFTPILIIDQVFDFKIFDKIEYLKIWNIIKLIFAPVMIVFGLSISLIFMNTLSGILSENKTDFTNVWIKTQKESTLEWLWITQPKEDCYSALWIRTFCTKLNIGWWLDNISYLIINIFGIAMMWALLFRTIQQTWSIWKKIWSSIEKSWRQFAWNIPIVPIWWWSMVWVNQVWWSGWLINTIWSQIWSEMGKDNQKKLAERFPGFYPQETKKDKTTTDNNKTNNNPQMSTEQISKIVEETKKWETISDTRLEELVWKEAKEQIWWWITNRIKQPDNIKLLFAEFEKQNTWKTNEDLTKSFGKALNINLSELKTIKDYQASIPEKDITTIMQDLEAKKLEAIVTTWLWQEITLKDKKKYKITKKSDWKYESQEVVALTQ